MSNDLSTHSILKPELGTLDIKTMSDLRQMCVYIIYISTFQHSWVNNKQYEDGGDVEYATLGLWLWISAAFMSSEGIREYKIAIQSKIRIVASKSSTLSHEQLQLSFEGGILAYCQRL